MIRDLDRVEWLARSLATSADRLRRYRGNPDAPAVFIAHETRLLERRALQLREVLEYGRQPGWRSEEIHD